MKKRKMIWVATLAAVTVAMASCLDSNGSSDYDKVEPVRPGIVIYNAAQSQNIASMQPADIALRLAFLRAEAEKQGKLDDMSSVTVANVGNVKNLLFGIGTRITEDAEDPGTYVIQYNNGGGQRPYDSFTRSGSVRVRTNDVALENTDASNRWSVTLESQKLTVTGGNTVTITTTGDTYIYRTDAAYEIGFNHAVSFIDEARKASWTGTFVLTPGKDDGLSFSVLKDASFKVSGSAAGQSFWSFNNVSAAGMSYTVTDGEYNPSRTNSATQIISGKEECRLTSLADYNIAQYPSAEVEIVWNVVGNAITYVVTYNGTSVSFS